ncbi:MAG: hypothetical protein WC835_00365 [Candidatus Paceibacterota bacterium]|jgi:hypothetical protein
MSDFPQALSNLKKFNSLILTNKELGRFFVFGDYNMLQSYQLPILVDFLSLDDKKKNSTGLVNKSAEQTAGFLVRTRQLVAIFISMLSYLFLVISRRRILIFAADKNTFPAYQCDFRMVNLFRYLFDKKIKFVEFFHTIFREDFTVSAIKRHRPAIYLEAIDVIYKLLSNLGFYKKEIKPLIDSIDLTLAGDEALFFRELLMKYANLTSQSLFRVRFMRNLLKFTGVKILIAAADTRNYNELVAACNVLGIETYGFQSGNLTKYDVGYLDCCGSKGRLMKPGKMIVESGYWKNELLRLGTYFKEDEIEIGGNMKEDYFMEAELTGGDDKKNNGLTVLIPYEIAAPKNEILEYIKKLLSCPNVRVVFKFRADRDLVEQALEYGLKDISGNLVLITDIKEIENFDIVAGTYSTFLYEMIGKLKPAVIFKTSLDYGEGMVINKLADEIDIKDNDFCGKLREIGGTSANILTARRNKLYGDYVPLASTLNKMLKL